MNEFENPLCRGRTKEFYPPEVRHYDRGNSKQARDAAAVVDRLREICRACTHQRDCYDLAVERRERFGVWGAVHFGDLRERGVAFRRAKTKSAVH